MISPLEAKDHNALWQLWNHPEIIPTKGTGVCTPFLEFAAWLAMRVRKTDDHLLFAMHQGEYIGQVTYDRDWVHIMIHPDYQGKGYGPRAIEETLPMAYTKWGEIPIIAGIVEGNERSVKMFEKLGFEYFEAGLLESGRVLLKYRR
jgi:RimJ/RimL family protein N-acetyltransferase